MSYSGTSTGLNKTIVVPALEREIPDGKNVIWCSSFQIAWNRLKDDLIKEPVEINNAGGISKFLNTAPQSESDISPESYFAFAGVSSPGLTDKFQNELNQKFPNSNIIIPGNFQNGLITYCYLEANVKFKYDYVADWKPILFTDSSGKKSLVSAFGLGWSEKHKYPNQRTQIKLFYYKKGVVNAEDEYILDLCVFSEPYQVILAKVKPQGTLAETVAWIDKKIDPTIFTDEEILDWKGIHADLKSKENLYVNALIKVMQSKNKDFALSQSVIEKPNHEIKQNFVKELNEILNYRTLYDEKLFKSLNIGWHLEQYIESHGIKELSDSSIRKINRRFIEHTFNGKIKRIDDVDPSEISHLATWEEDLLSVPNIYWDIEHHFSELEGPDKKFSNRGFEETYLDAAIQRTRFKLDRKGAEVSSEAVGWLGEIGDKNLEFNRPFLLYMKKRGAKYPFLVMWIDNAELLCKP